MQALHIPNKMIVLCGGAYFLFLALLGIAPLAISGTGVYDAEDHTPFMPTAQTMLAKTPGIQTLPPDDTATLAPLVAQSLASYGPNRTQATLHFLGRYQCDSSHNQSDAILPKMMAVFQALCAPPGLVDRHITSVGNAFFAGFHQYTTDGHHHVQVIRALVGLIDTPNFEDIATFIHENELVYPPVNKEDIPTIFTNIRRAWSVYTPQQILAIINEHVEAGMAAATHIELWVSPTISDDENTDDDPGYLTRTLTEEEADQWENGDAFDRYS